MKRYFSSLSLPVQVVLLAAFTLISLLLISHPLHRPNFPSSEHPTTWLSRIKSDPHTRRLACREYDAGAQSCVFLGLSCINTSSQLAFSRPKVYIIDHNFEDRRKLPSDNWCSLRYQSSDPRYFASRHWPIKTDTVAPQRSCLDAEYRTLHSLNLDANVRWVPDISLIDLDNVKNNHNNHLLKDILWLLDVSLWQQSLQLDPSVAHFPTSLFDQEDRFIYLPQGRNDFIAQTSRDINRLLYSLVLRFDPTNLYPNFTHSQLQSATATPRQTAQLLDVFPDLNKRLLFHRDILNDNTTDLVCAPRLTVGAKIGNGGHERVCRHLRQSAYHLFGIPNPVMRRLGRIYYPQPPKRIIILQRHISRKFANLEQLETAIRSQFTKHAVAVEVIDTRALGSAEAQVRIFSRAGVLVTPHGSQAMGQIFMPRHSSLIEVMPVGYTDYAFNLLADSCKIWYYEVQGVLGGGDRDLLEKECGDKVPHMMNPCTQVKSKDVWADIPKVVDTIKFALERMGYPIGKWPPE